MASIVGCLAQLTKFGVAAEDAPVLPKLREACTELAVLREASAEPPLRDDPRLIGDWELVGTTSTDLAERKGLTGLGSAPFTSPVALFYTHKEDGQVLAKEVLEFFGNPVVVNEVREPLLGGVLLRCPLVTPVCTRPRCVALAEWP